MHCNELCLYIVLNMDLESAINVYTIYITRFSFSTQHKHEIHHIEREVDNVIRMSKYYE